MACVALKRDLMKVQRTFLRSQFTADARYASFSFMEEDNAFFCFISLIHLMFEAKAASLSNAKGFECISWRLRCEYIANYCKLGLRCKFFLETKTKGADHSTNAFGKV